MVGLKRIKRLKYFIPFALVFGVAFFILRGPHISNSLKKVILPELEMASGRKVIAQHIYINIFPLFIEAKGMKVFDDRGEKILFIQRAKAYIDLAALFTREIRIKRLVLKEPDLLIEKKEAEEIAENINKYISMTRDTALKVKISSAEIRGGSAEITDGESHSSAVLKNLRSELIFGNTQKIKADSNNILLKKDGWPDIDVSAAIDLSATDGTINFNKITVGSAGSWARVDGRHEKGKVTLRANIELFLMTLKKLFNLNNSGVGKVYASGLIHYGDKKLDLELKIDGNFYLQALMELLKVTERVEGLIEVRGVIKGPLSNLRAHGSAKLHHGNLFNVDVDALACAVSYENGTMKFTDGSGKLFNGVAKLSAAISLPVVDTYSLSVDFSNVDSKPVFGLIGWDPGVQPGKVQGHVSSSGEEFNPYGWFEYKSTTEGKDVLGRMKDMKGKYSLNGSVLTLKDLVLSTGLTSLNAGGTADIENEVLDIAGTLSTADVNDLSSPYYPHIRGKAEFRGKITGDFSDPTISGTMKIFNPVFYGYDAESMTADISYRKALLNLRSMDIRGNGEGLTMKGEVMFRKARELFEFSAPEYRLNAHLNRGNFSKIAKIFFPEFNGSGKLTSRIEIRGTAEHPEIRGESSLEDAAVNHVPFDTASFVFLYKGEKISFVNSKITSGSSVVSLDADIDKNGKFFYKASSDRILLSDLVRKEIRGDAVISVKSEGSGSFDNPLISVQAKMIEGKLKGKPVGTGAMTVSIRDRNVSLQGNLFNDRISFSGTGRIDNEMPWKGKIDIQPGRYDSLVGAFLKDAPDDLLLNMSGSISAHGDRNNIFAESKIKQITLSMYGYAFTNESEIRVGLENRRLVLDKLIMRSGDMSLQVNGSLVIGKEYNLSFEGNSDLSPFKSLSTRIGLLKGDGEFVLSITGDWESPQINGGVTLKNGSFGLKDYSYRISSLNGYLYLDNDRIVLQKLAGKIGGGDLDLSGIVYLKKFSVKRFYIEAGLNNITTSFSSDFSVNYSGNILLKGTPSSQIVSGDIRIDHARYRERVEWKSWLLKTKNAEKFKTEISEIDKAALNIKISGRNNIIIDNNIARTSVSVDMILKGSVYRPILFGRLEANEGTVYFRNNDFRILHASADFSDPNRFNPVIIITAETIIKGYKIRMNLEGKMDHFSMSLSSDPTLKEMDILSLLAVGQKGGELKGLEGGIGAGEATSFVTGKLQDVVEERLRNITGLDRFQIDPYISKTTRIVEPRLTLSKRLLGEKVFVTYTSSVSSIDEQIIKIEYFLSRNVSLIGVRDERGILGGDIRFSFEFK